MYRYLVTRPWSPIFAPGVFWRTELFREIGGYDENYTFTEDWPCWIKLARNEVQFCFVDDIVVKSVSYTHLVRCWCTAYSIYKTQYQSAARKMCGFFGMCLPFSL